LPEWQTGSWSRRAYGIIQLVSTRRPREAGQGSLYLNGFYFKDILVITMGKDFFMSVEFIFHHYNWDTLIHKVECFLKNIAQ
jgi:hypothetical protein